MNFEEIDSDDNGNSMELSAPSVDGEAVPPAVVPVASGETNSEAAREGRGNTNHREESGAASPSDREMPERGRVEARLDSTTTTTSSLLSSSSSRVDTQPLMPPPRRRHSPQPSQEALRSRATSGSSRLAASASSSSPRIQQQQQPSQPSSSSSSQSALRRQAHLAAAPGVRPRAAQQQQDTLLQQPTRRSTSMEYEPRGGAGGGDDQSSLSSSASLQQQQQHQGRGRSAPPLGHVPHLSCPQQHRHHHQSYNYHNNKPAVQLQFHDPEETNEEEMEEFYLHHQGDAGDDDKDPVPVSGWSLVEVSNEPGAGVPPSARSLHAATLLNGTMYVFGGFDGQTRVNSFFAFSFAGRRWSPVLPAAGPPPSPRDRHVAVAFGNSIYVHGGFDGTSRVSDFWAFDFSTMTWREVVALQGTPPSARHSHCAAVMNHSLYIACGYDGSYKSDLYQFDFTLSRWTNIRVSGRRPRARYRATLNAVRRPTPSLILHGGHDGTRHLADTHVFDLETQEWSSLVIDGVPPIPRDSHVAVNHANSIYVFGGSSGAALNDLHELQLPSSKHQPARWRPVNAGRGTQPQPRFCHAAVVYHDTLYSFGGYSGSERINEFLKFDFALYDLTFEVPPSTINTELRSLVNSPTLSDVTFVVEGREIYAHKLLLIRCEYFQSLFLGSMMESTASRIPIEQVRYSVFLSLLEYLYTDHVRIPLSSAMELFEAADLFMIPRLKTICEKRMLQSISVSNAASIFYAADMHSAMALRQKAKKYILSHFEEVSKTSSFEEMGRGNIDLVFELLKSR